MINGRHFNWEAITINTPWGTLIEVTSINYKSGRGVVRLKGAKGRTTGVARKGYEASGDLEIRREEFQELLKYMKDGVLGDEFMTITVSGSLGSVTWTDTLPDVLFEEVDTGSQVDDDDLKVKLNMFIGSPILYDGYSPFKGAA